MTDERRRKLLTAMAVCARAAARLTLDRVAPNEVPIRTWNAARPRVAATHGWLPLGQELHRQLTCGQPSWASWAELLDEALKAEAGG